MLTFTKKISKMAAASAMALTMIASTATALPITVNAGEQLGVSQYNQFDNGVGLPWHVCESGPSKLSFNMENGSYNVKIVNPGGAQRGGESRWDCQLRHRKLKITAGHTYTVKYEVTADQSGQIYTKIGDLSGDIELWHNGCNDSTFGNSWDCVPVTANQTLKVETSFKASQSLDVAEWAFHFGGQGQWQPQDCFPEGTTLKFDNLSLVDTSSNDNDWDTRFPNISRPNNAIRVNQVGYFSKLDKKATLVVDANDTTPKEFSLLDSTGKEVYKGTSSPMAAEDDDSDQWVHILDFSEYTGSGADYTLKCGDGTSYKFAINDNVYDGILTNAVNYYYQNRSGIPIEEKYITSGDKGTLAHQAGHTTDTAYVQSKWVKSYKADGSDVEKSKTIDGTGGWYDAGDHGKYVVNGGISVWTLNNMYERSLVKGDASKWADGSGTVVVPEAGNKNPDILDETRVEMEWMFKMISENGMVYHKLHDHKWTGLAVKPWDYATEWGTIRIVKPVSTAATLNLVACAAQSARLWKDLDPTFSAKCLENAKKCYTAAKADPANYAPLDQAIGGGAYGDTEVKDDFYWAATELYATTKDATYKTDLLGYSNALKTSTTLNGGENSGTFTSFNWGNTAGLGNLTLALYSKDLLTDAESKTLTDSLVSAADTYIKKEDEQGYGLPYQQSDFTDETNAPGVKFHGYEWGSNSMVVNNAIVLGYAYDLTGDRTYIDGMSESMDYIFGRNALDMSYVTGYGTYHTENPHHRYWSHELDPSFPLAPAGVMSGGANSGMQDPYIKGMGYKVNEVAPQLCYCDSVESWSTNEVTINWNAPFAWAVSFLEDEAPIVPPENSTALKLDKTAVTVEVGKTDTVKATTGTVIKWESADTSVAKVTDGVITGVKDGTTTVTATDADGNKATVKVTVTKVGGETTGSGTETPGDVVYGDVNLDTKVNILDVAEFCKIVGTGNEFTNAQAKKNADCVADGVIDMKDALAVLQFITKTLSKLPA